MYFTYDSTKIRATLQREMKKKPLLECWQLSVLKKLLTCLFSPYFFTFIVIYIRKIHGSHRGHLVSTSKVVLNIIYALAVCVWQPYNHLPKIKADQHQPCHIVTKRIAYASVIPQSKLATLGEKKITTLRVNIVVTHRNK